MIILLILYIYIYYKDYFHIIFKMISEQKIDVDSISLWTTPILYLKAFPMSSFKVKFNGSLRRDKTWGSAKQIL